MAAPSQPLFRVRLLRPRRTGVQIRLKGAELDVPAAEAAAMLRKGEAVLVDMRGLAALAKAAGHGDAPVLQGHALMTRGVAP